MAEVHGLAPCFGCGKPLLLTSPTCPNCGWSIHDAKPKPKPPEDAPKATKPFMPTIEEIADARAAAFAPKSAAVDNPLLLPIWIVAGCALLFMLIYLANYMEIQSEKAKAHELLERLLQPAKVQAPERPYNLPPMQNPDGSFKPMKGVDY